MEEQIYKLKEVLLLNPRERESHIIYVKTIICGDFCDDIWERFLLCLNLYKNIHDDIDMLCNHIRILRTKLIMFLDDRETDILSFVDKYSGIIIPLKHHNKLFVEFTTEFGEIKMLVVKYQYLGQRDIVC